ncbi:MAG: tyrosine-type recombinase/integrase [Janthinobacterium lividum]
MSTKTYLAARNPSSTDVAIYAEYSHDRKVKRVPTGERVPLAQWDNVMRSMIGTGSAAINKTINKVLATLEAQVQKLYLENGNVYPTVEQLSQQQNQQATHIQAVATETPLTSVLVAWMATKEDWADSTLRNFNTVLANIKDYEQAHGVVWYLSKLINEDIRNWQQWLKKAKPGKQQQGYNDQTLHKRVRLLRQFLRQHPAPQVNLNHEATKALHATMQTIPFVLSQNDLNAIETLDLAHDQRLAEIRDMMVLQAFCGLRFSDLERLTERHLTESHISIRMKKSGAKAVQVYIPLVRQSRQIIAKYTTNGTLQLPLKYSQEFNYGIRAVCRLIPSLHANHTQDRRLRGKGFEYTKPKYKFVTSHTLRRTFVSICLDKGFATKEVMSWSGHTTLSAFQRYIGATEQRSDNGKEFDARWEAAQITPVTTQQVSLTLSQEDLRNILSGLPISAEARQVLSAQYAISMQP